MGRRTEGGEGERFDSSSLCTPYRGALKFQCFDGVSVRECGDEDRLGEDAVEGGRVEDGRGQLHTADGGQGTGLTQAHLNKYTHRGDKGEGELFVYRQGCRRVIIHVCIR